MLKTTSFSKKQLLLFAVIFGLIGGYFIWKGSAAPNPNLLGDLNGDNTVNVSDLSILLSSYGTTNTNADINKDGSVNILDMSILLSHYATSYTPPPPSGMGQMFITSTELMSKPTSGTGWTFLKSKADTGWGITTLADQNTTVQTYVLAAALVYARTGDTSYKDKVINAVKQVCGTEINAAQELNVARTLFGYVVSADMVQMPQSILCNNGQSWLQFLQAIRTENLAGNSRWPSLEITSADTSSNWGAYSLASHLAVSYALNDTAAITRDTDIFKRFLGDTSSPASAFNSTAAYRYNGDGATWDSTPTLQRGINPLNGVTTGLIEDTLRLTEGADDSVPCCTPGTAGISYQEETMDAFFSTMQLLKAHGIDLRTFQDSAAKRAFVFYITNGGPSQYSINHYLPYVINYWYGTTYSTTLGDSVSRHLGYGGWLFTGTP